MNICVKFPETALVKCVFAYRQSNTSTYKHAYDQYDRMNDADVQCLKEYTYRVPEALKGTLSVGDAVLVHCQTGYQLCEITAVNAMSDFDEGTFAPVVCKVDLKTYYDSVEREHQLKEMRHHLLSEKKRLEAMLSLDILAEKSPEFKQLLDAFKALGGKL